MNIYAGTHLICSVISAGSAATGAETHVNEGSVWLCRVNLNLNP